ncbi:MAG: chromate transporter [Chthonomonadales bacterium]
MNAEQPGECVSSAQDVSLWDLARRFLVIGATGFGGGMAIIALMQKVCVEECGWIGVEEFAHGVAFGQILGPFAVNAATFVGYRLRGLPGAIVAASAFMAPSVALVIVLSAVYFRFHEVPALQAALKGIEPVIVALILYAAVQMGGRRMQSLEAVVVAAVAFAMLMMRIPVAVIIGATVAYGCGHYWVRGRRG